MNKLLLITTLLVSTTLGAHNSFHSNFFNNGLNNGFWHDFDQQFQQLDRQLNQLKQSSNNFGMKSRQYFDKDNNNYVVQISIKGLTKDNLDISTANNTITIKGNNRIENKSSNGSSRSSSSFAQSFSLPNDADKDNINATFQDNVLTVSIPKLSKPKPRIQKIQIQ